jgi:hypothetical protein
MHIVQRLGHGHYELHNFVGRQPRFPQSSCKIGADDELRDDVAGELLGATHVIIRQNVRMNQIDDRASFRQLRLELYRAFHPFPMRRLDRHGSLQLIIVSQVDEAEAALVQNPLNSVATDSLRVLIGVNVINGGFGTLQSALVDS